MSQVRVRVRFRVRVRARARVRVRVRANPNPDLEPGGRRGYRPPLPPPLRPRRHG